MLVFADAAVRVNPGVVRFEDAPVSDGAAAVKGAEAFTPPATDSELLTGVDQLADFAGYVLLGMTTGPLETIAKQGIEHLITHEGDDVEAHNFGVNTGALHPLVPMSWGDLRLIPANWQVGVAHRLARPPLSLPALRSGNRGRYPIPRHN